MLCPANMLGYVCPVSLVRAGVPLTFRMRDAHNRAHVRSQGYILNASIGREGYTLRGVMRPLIFISLLSLCVAAFCPLSDASGTLRPDKKIEAAVEPILEAALAAGQHDTEATEFELGKPWERSLTTRVPRETKA